MNQSHEYNTIQSWRRRIRRQIKEVGSTLASIESRPVRNEEEVKSLRARINYLENHPVLAV